MNGLKLTKITAELKEKKTPFVKGLLEICRTSQYIYTWTLTPIADTRQQTG